MADGFGDRLRHLRRDANLTQGELALKLEVVPSAVGKYERMPKAYPSIDVLLKISEYFRVTTDFLLKGIKPQQLAENNISAALNNSSFIQANHGGIVWNSRELSPEAMELIRVYENLNGRKRFELLRYAVELEDNTNEIKTDDKKSK